MKKLLIVPTVLVAALFMAGSTLTPCKFVSMTGLAWAASCPKGYCITRGGCCDLRTKRCACM